MLILSPHSCVTSALNRCQYHLVAYQFACTSCLSLIFRISNHRSLASVSQFPRRPWPLGLRYLIGRTLQVDCCPPPAARVFTRRHDFYDSCNTILGIPVSSQRPHAFGVYHTANHQGTAPASSAILRLRPGHLFKGGHPSLQESSLVAPRCPLVTVRFNRAFRS